MGPSTRSKEQAEEKKRRKEKENKMTLSKFISKKAASQQGCIATGVRPFLCMAPLLCGGN